MSSHLSVVVVDRPGERTAHLEQMLVARGWRVVATGDAREALRLIETTPVDLCVLNTTLPDPGIFVCYAHLRPADRRAEVPILMLVATPDLRRRASSAVWQELDEYAVEPCSAIELALRCEAMLARTGRLNSQHAEAAPAAEARPQGQVVLVCSNKGGVGKTTVACNLAVALHALGGRRVVLMDGNLECGDVASMLDLAPASDLANLLPVEDRLDVMAVESVLTRHSSGIDVLPAPPEPVLSERISNSLVGATVRMLRRLADVIVIDGPTSFGERALDLMDLADRILLVITPEVPAVKNAMTFLKVAGQLGHGARVQIVVNRAGGRFGIESRQLGRYFGEAVVAQLPSDAATVVTAMNRGVPFVAAAPGSPIAAEMRQLAARVAGVEGEAPRPAPRPGLFRQLMGRWPGAAASGQVDEVETAARAGVASRIVA